jgi:uncharacterized membrane protein YozB (DUF420 family)
MNSFLGTSARLGSDLALVLSLALAVVAFFGVMRARRQRFSTHCPVMAWAALLHWLPVLVVMLPNWLEATTGESQLAGTLALTPIFHGVLGGVAQLLMTYTVVRMYWFEQLPPDQPIWLMRTTAVLWLLTVIGGSAVYVVKYVL